MKKPKRTGRLARLIRLFQRPRLLTAKITYLEPNQRLRGKKIIITGGGRGLGYAMAKKFQAEGAEVLIAGRSNEALKKAASEIGCNYIQYDVSDFQHADDFITKADEMLDGANVLINNAGVSLHEGNIFDVNEDQYDVQFNTNLKAGYFLTQKFLKRYIDNNRKGGSVLFLSSERGQHVDDLPYGLIKASVNSLTQGLAKMLIRNDIRINAIAPGITATEMTGKSADNLYAPGYSTGRYYLPDEVAEIACFLTSDAAGCISGQILICNNGKSVNYRK